MRKIAILAVTVGLTLTGSAQLRVTSVEKVPLPREREWHSPRFSPDGERIYLTQPNYTGIWEYERESRALRRVTPDRGAGYGFALSGDGARIAYRRASYEKTTRRRSDEIVVQDLRGAQSTVVASGRGLSLPAFDRSQLVYDRSGKLEKPPMPGTGTGTCVLGIEDTKILLVRDGTRLRLDPLGGGRYIWPALSPDRARIVAVEMARGAFVCDLDGTVLSELGRCHAPAWTRDGKWVIYMDDRDDGHRLTASDLMAVSPDGSRRVRLIDTPEVFEMYPDCSPVADEILCSTATGEVYILHYGGDGE